MMTDEELTPNQLRVLRRCDDQHRVRIRDAREVYSRDGDARNALKALVRKGYLSSDPERADTFKVEKWPERNQRQTKEGLERFIE